RDDDGGRDVGQDVAQGDAQGTGTQRPGRPDVVALFLAQDGGPDEPGDGGPAEEGHQHDDAVHTAPAVIGECLGQAELGDVDGGEHDQERQQRQGDDGISEAHEEAVGA
ncbi:hypothetical protein RZS08_55650, partial [Arthrospira platensis SPKY1]|nr:hypothetical protein [Arthrospira platensis SPKY1]